MPRIKTTFTDIIHGPLCQCHDTSPDRAMVKKLSFLLKTDNVYPTRSFNTPRSNMCTEVPEEVFAAVLEKSCLLYAAEHKFNI